MPTKLADQAGAVVGAAVVGAELTELCGVPGAVAWLPCLLPVWRCLGVAAAPLWRRIADGARLDRRFAMSGAFLQPIAATWVHLVFDALVMAHAAHFPAVWDAPVAVGTNVAMPWRYGTVAACAMALCVALNALASGYVYGVLRRRKRWGGHGAGVVCSLGTAAEDAAYLGLCRSVLGVYHTLVLAAQDLVFVWLCAVLVKYEVGQEQLQQRKGEYAPGMFSMQAVVSLFMAELHVVTVVAHLLHADPPCCRLPIVAFTLGSMGALHVFVTRYDKSFLLESKGPNKEQRDACQGPLGRPCVSRGRGGVCAFYNGTSVTGRNVRTGAFCNTNPRDAADQERVDNNLARAMQVWTLLALACVAWLFVRSVRELRRAQRRNSSGGGSSSAANNLEAISLFKPCSSVPDVALPHPDQSEAPQLRPKPFPKVIV